MTTENKSERSIIKQHPPPVPPLLILLLNRVLDAYIQQHIMYNIDVRPRRVPGGNHRTIATIANVETHSLMTFAFKTYLWIRRLFLPSSPIRHLFPCHSRLLTGDLLPDERFAFAAPTHPCTAPLPPPTSASIPISLLSLHQIFEREFRPAPLTRPPTILQRFCFRLSPFIHGFYRHNYLGRCDRGGVI